MGSSPPMKSIEIMDTTLRDGEQTSGVSFSTSEKMAITRLLLQDLHVPRVEIASARVSEGERATVARICSWAAANRCIEAIEVLGFIDRGKSVDWVKGVGAKVINLLAKGSEKHCRLQLRMTPDDLATANVLAAVKAGARGIHCTVNGLGERAGNATLSSSVTALHDMLGVTTGIDESKINKVSHIVESFSGIPVPPNKPIIGESVFTQCAGVHADGDNKSKLYYNDLLPERFGREREYALGKTSGRANIRKNLEALGIELSDEEVLKVTDRVIQLGDKKELVSQADLPFIVADVLRHSALPARVRVVNYALNLAQGLRPTATVKLIVDDTEYQESAVGDGQFDAFMRAVRTIYTQRLGRTFPTLSNYSVNIPPGGRTDALVQTTVTWNHEGTSIKTRGLDADQTEAAIRATVKMLNIIENK